MVNYNSYFFLNNQIKLMGHIRVDLPNMNNKWVEFGLANVDTFIIRVRFGLSNIDTIRTLTRHEHDSLTRIATFSVIP